MLKKTTISLLAILALTACNKKRAPLGQQKLADTVYFDYNSSDLGSVEKQNLDKQACYLLAKKECAIIEGHCDERGTREYNLALGERRANAVKHYLESHGVSSGSLTATSYGKEKPIDAGHNETAWAKNRRAVTLFSGNKYSK